MREILFRGKAINRNKGYHKTKYKNGDWVYGLLTNMYDEQFENLPAEITNEYGISGIEIDHKTIGQYTGLTDKNGNKIFEGDIVYCKSRLDNANMVVIFECGQFRMILSENYYSYQTNSGFYDINCFDKEVIGNIHDNPELLKGE